VRIVVVDIEGKHHRASVCVAGGPMSNRSITLTDSFYEYMNEVSLRESPPLSMEDWRTPRRKRVRRPALAPLD
jgi:hypothetical protein